VFPVAQNLSVTSTFSRAGIAKFILMYTCVRLILFIINTTGLAPLRQLHSYVIARCSSQRQTTLASEQVFGVYSSFNQWTTITRVRVFL